MEGGRVKRTEGRDVGDWDDLGSPQNVLWAFGGVALGGALALLILPELAPALAASLAGPQPKTWWYLSRASGLVSYALFATSMLLGLLLSTRFAKEWPGNATVFALHEHASILGLAFALLHALSLLGDRYAPFTVAALIVPFGGAYRPVAVGLGQLAFYGAAPLVVSFYVRRRIGQRTWRLIHFGTFAVFALALSHGLAAGSDRTLMLVGFVPAGVVVFFTAYRVLWHVFGTESAPAGTASPRSSPPAAGISVLPELEVGRRPRAALRDPDRHS
jgi:predicted ferric reductase